MIRIRYTLKASGWRESQPILTEYRHTIAAYREDLLQWRLTSYDTEMTIVEGKESTVYGLKRRIRKELVSLGARFDSESRQ